MYLYTIIEKYKSNNNYKGIYLGLRNEESRYRIYNYVNKGHTYKYLYKNEWICNPLYNWKGKDIFAYLIMNEIEPFEIYKKCKFNKPTEIRKSWYLPGSRSQYGQEVYLKYYYPMLHRRV